jgi:hypothetical protein
MALSNVALTDTFDVWRTRTNQIVSLLNGTDSNVIRFQSNTTVLNVTPGVVPRGGIAYFTLAISTDTNDTSTSNVASANTAYTNRELTKTVFGVVNTAIGAIATANGNITSAFLKANLAAGAIATANGNITSAFDAANTASPTSAFNQANAAIGAIATANGNITSAFNAANTASPTSAFNQANAAIGAIATANGNITSAFLKANNALANTTGATFNGILNVSQDVYIFRSLGVGAAASTVTGEIRAANNVTAYYSSDSRLKQNVTAITNPLEKVKSIRGVEFDWTDNYIEQHGGEDGYFVRKHDVGVIAQELEIVLPEVVATRTDGMKAVKYDRIVALLIEAIKELEEKVAKLETK